MSSSCDKSSWCCRWDHREEWCGTREDSPGRSGLWASSSGCSLSNINMIQVSAFTKCYLFFICVHPKPDYVYCSAGVGNCTENQCLHLKPRCVCLVYSGQVDWAALAQAWIAQKESTGPPPHSVQPNGQDIPSVEPVGQSNHGNFQGDPPFNRVWQPSTGTDQLPFSLLKY